MSKLGEVNQLLGAAKANINEAIALAQQLFPEGMEVSFSISYRQKTPSTGKVLRIETAPYGGPRLNVVISHDQAKPHSRYSVRSVDFVELCKSNGLQ